MFKFIYLAVPLFTVGVSFWTSGASALPSPYVVKPGKLSAPLKEGAVVGGQADREFSLLNVVSKTIAKGERITLTYGDVVGKPVSGEPGFFHAVLDRGSKRIVIDLAQVGKTRVDAETLRKTFASSRFVSSTDITMDPHDGSTNITLNLKSPVTFLAGTDVRKGSQIVFELREVSGSSK
ncbi:MAG: hypothetical protein V4692_01025 [Bdellovibrionota bacterium]